MCKKIVLRGKTEAVMPDRSLDYVYEEIGLTEAIPMCDILILPRDNLFSIVETVVSMRATNPICRIVLEHGPYQENLISALFPFAEFLREGKVLLSSVYSGEGTYRHDYQVRALSWRETKLLDPLSYGMSDKEISLLLGISQRTVVRTKQRVIEKTGLLSSGQLSIFSAARNWISEREDAVKKGNKIVQSLCYERERENHIQTS